MIKPKVLLIYPLRSSFVVSDIECLQEKFEVIEYAFGLKKNIFLVIRMVQLFFWLCLRIMGFKRIYIWFADTHGLWPALFGKLFKIKVVTFIGGYDAVAIPDLKYGAHLIPLRSFIVRCVCNLSDVLVPSSKYTGEQLITTLSLPKLRSKIRVAYPKVNPDSFPLINLRTRKNIVCIAGGNSINRMLLKGVDRFIEVAGKLVEYPFVLVGPDGLAAEWVKQKASENLSLITFSNQQKLVEILNTSSIICLFSRNEAFGMVIIEGMLCGNTPVAMKDTGTAEIMEFKDSPGILIEEFNSSNVASLILNQLETTSMMDIKRNREYALINFSGSDRCRAITDI